MKRLAFISLIAVMLLAACAPKARESSVAQGFSPFGGAPVAPAVPQSDEAMEEAPGEPSTGNRGSGADTAAIERLVIQNADISIVVQDVQKRLDDVEALAARMGGHVVSSNLYQTSTRNGLEVPQAQVVIRVPSDQLEEALKAIKQDVVETTSESLSGQDVTAEYVDLSSRLKNLEATEAQLVKIMESATETDDVLNVFNQLTSIREQIEVIKGQMKYYEESAAMSAITVNIMAEETLQPIEIGGWKPQGVARDAIQDLVYFFQGFVEFLIRLVLLVLPALVLIAIPVYLAFLGVRALVRRFRKPKATPQAAEPEQK